MDQDSPVLIIGAGVVGLTLAHGLANVHHIQFYIQRYKLTVTGKYPI